MGVYENAEDLYKYMGKTFSAAFENAELAERLHSTGATIKMHFTDPESTISVDFGKGIVEFGDESTLTPDVDLYMEADTAHHFWLGKVNVPMAMAKGKIKSKGSIGKVLKIAPMMKPMYSTYEGILREAGLEELIDR